MKIKNAIGIFGLFGYMYLLGLLGVWIGTLTGTPAITMCVVVTLSLIFSIIWFKHVHIFACRTVRLALIISIIPWLILIFLSLGAWLGVDFPDCATVWK